MADEEHREDPQARSTEEDRRPEDGLPTYVKVDDLREEGDDNTCLRPLGLCDLGGCCDICWYRPDHPRFKDRKKPSRGEG